MRISISRDVFGSPQTITWDSDGTYTLGATTTDWVVGDPPSLNSLDELAWSVGVDLSWSASQSQEAAMRAVLGRDPELKMGDVRWDLALPRDVFRQHLTDLLGRSQDVVKNSSEGKYLEFFRMTQELCCTAQVLSVDEAGVRASLEGCPVGRRPELESLLTGLPSRYSRKTSTGRCTVVSGPRTLTLDKKYRHHIRSAYGDDGVVLSLDFVSLEPRVLLALSGRDAPGDVYEGLMSKVPGLTREKAKVATMSILYGGSVEKLATLLGDDVDVRTVYNEVRRQFGLKFLEDDLVREVEEKGHLMNFFGRIMNVSRRDPGYLVAAHVQSTAVDVAILGFRQLLAQLAEPTARYVGLVHDAVWLDVPRAKVPLVEAAAATGVVVDGLATSFGLTCKPLVS